MVTRSESIWIKLKTVRQHWGGKRMNVQRCPPALTELGSREMVEQIVSFHPFFEQVAPLAAVCSTTWNVLRLPLQDHAHNVRQHEEHRIAIWLNEWEMQQPALAIDYWWEVGAIGVRHVNDGRP